MTIQQTYHYFRQRTVRNIIIVFCLLGLVSITVFVDFLFAQHHQTSFYLSESLLFSTFWFLFLPLLYMQTKLTLHTGKIYTVPVIAATAVVIHLLIYPVIIWLLSRVLFQHSFPYWQTFSFALTEHLIKTVIVYGLAAPIIILYKNRQTLKPITTEKVPEIVPVIRTIIVSDSGNKKTVIETAEIIYFSASTPYTTIHHANKKYLSAETLKALNMQLDSKQFIRIHKSHMVNIKEVVTYQSRLNGDYDATLTDGTILRVSRNYAADFKTLFALTHPVAVK